MSNTETANGDGTANASDPLSSAADIGRLISLSTLLIRTVKLVADAKAVGAMARNLWSEYAAYQLAIQAKAKAENDAEDLAAAGK